MSGVVVVGVGNPTRGDDGVGLHVLDAVRPRLTATRCVALDGEPARLLEAWRGADLAVVVDACRSGAPAGTVVVVDLRDAPLDELGGMSSHAGGLAAAVALGTALDRLPPSLHAVLVEVADVGLGVGLSPAVASAVPDACRAVLALLAGQARLPLPA